MRYSSRLDWTVQPNPLSQALAAKHRAGSPVLDLTQSNPTQAGIEYPAATIGGAFNDASLLRYDPDPAGSRAVRELVAEYYGARVRFPGAHPADGSDERSVRIRIQAAVRRGR